MFRAILVGVDDRDASEAAVLAAVDLARRLHAELELVHGADLPASLWPWIGREVLASIEADQRASIRARIAERLRCLRERGEDLSLGERPLETRLHVVSAPPAKALLDRALRGDADLIVLGEHERRGAADIGGTARAVLAKAPCPTWIQNGPRREVARILAPVDLSDHSRVSLEGACELARRLRARVHVLHALVPSHPILGADALGALVGETRPQLRLRDAAQGHLDALVESIDWSGVEREVELVEEEPRRALLARQEGFDLIAMGTHGATGLAAAVLGSTAWAAVRGARIPLLLFPQPRRAWIL